jgi:hypothetical protein
MRMVFGVVSLLVVLAILGVVARKQMNSLSVPAAASSAAGLPAASGTPAQQSKQIQNRVRDDVNQLMQQAASRPELAQ